MKNLRDVVRASQCAHVQAHVLAEALPYMQRYDREIVVVKIGGNAMADPKLFESFANDIVLLKQSNVSPIVVHGGGPQIGAMLKQLNIESEFRHGLRVTDEATINVVEMVLAGSINKEIVGAINRKGGKAVGISGKDGNLMWARKLDKMIVDPESNIMQDVDLGFVGEPTKVDPHIVTSMIENDLIPVIAPVATSREGVTLNINADTFAGELAARMLAKRLLLLTDVEGVLDKSGKLIAEMTIDDAKRLINDGTVSGGMIPKIKTCMAAVQNGVEAVVVVDGKVPHAVLLELFTAHGAGTLLGKARE